MKPIYLFLCFFTFISGGAQTIDFQTSLQFKSALVSSGTIGGITYNSAGQHVIIDTNNDGAIQYTEAAAIYEIKIENNYSMQGLQGLQYFTGLKKFTAINTGITAVNFQPLTGLEYVKLYDTFTSVILSGLANLKTIDIQQTEIMGLNLTGLTALEDVNISHNSINTGVNVSGLTTLKNLDTSYNYTGTVNVTGCVNLEKLNLINNNLSTINLTGLTNLIELNVSNNHLSQLNVDGFTALKKLSCGGNNLTALNIQTLSSLEYLYFDNNLITALNPQGLTHLIEISGSNNQLTSLNVQGLSTLYNLGINNNKITSLDAHGLPLLKFLYASDNLLTSLNVLGLPKLEYLHFANNQLTSVNLSEVPKLVYLVGNNNLLTTINMELCPFISSFKLQNNQLASLYIKNGKVENVWDFSNNPSLAYICADEDQIDFIENSGVQYGMPNLVVDSYCTISNVTNNTLNGTVTFYSLPGGGGTASVAQNIKIYNSSDDRRSSTNGQGNYSFTFNSQPSGTVRPHLENSNLFNLPLVSYSFSNPGGEILNKNISFWPLDNTVTGKADVEVVLVPIVGARPGEDAVFKILLRNKGNAAASGALNFTFDDAALDLVTATPVADSQQPNTLSWNYVNLLPFETREINLTVNVNTPTETPSVSQGYILNYSAVATLTSGTDYKPDDNTFNYNQMVVNSFDPNDKTCLQGGLIPTSAVGKYLHYLIRFENTGTANANTIVVTDRIDLNKYDIDSIEILKSSHPCSMVHKGGRIEFVFENINLPFDNANNDGYVVFKIKTVSYLTQGDVVSNKARIYFDYNYPIITNNAITSVGQVPIPVVTSPQGFCNSATVNNLTANNPIGTIKWYAAQTGGAPLSSSTALTNGTVYYASQTISGYESTRVPVTATIYEIVAPTIPAQQAFCDTAYVSQLNPGNAVTVKWYTSLTSTTALPPATPLVNGAVYYASQTIMFCESSGRAPVTVTINHTDPPVLPAQQNCPLSTIASLNTGNAVNPKWYASQTAVTPLSSNVLLFNNSTYYLSQTINNCESARVPQTVTTSNMTAPVIPSSQSFCKSVMVSNLNSGNAVNVKWYSSSTSTTPLDPSQIITSSGIYYASQTPNNCESFKAPTSITIYQTPVPVPPTLQIFCGSATVSNLISNALDALWYDSPTATIPLNPSTAVTGGTYYVTQTVVFCESAKVAVNVSVISNQGPVLPSSQTFCNAATVNDLNSGNATNIKWYSSATETTPLSSTAALSNGTYYASQTTVNCESLRTAVTVTINHTDAPVVPSAQTFCNAATVNDLTIGNATNVKWYGSATETTALNSTAALSNGTYYASQTMNNCESERTAVTVTINNTDIPVVPSAQSFCNAATVNDLTIGNATNIKWYGSATETTALSSTAALSNGTYYASQTINNCESERTAVTVTINYTDVPVVPSAQSFCNAATVNDLTTGNATNIKWYGSPTETTPLNSTAALSNGIYYASQSINNCESPRAAVTVTINLTDAPALPSPQTFCNSATVNDLNINNAIDVKWYDSATDNTLLNGTTSLVNGATYYASQTINNCESIRTAVTATLIQITPPQGNASQTAEAGSTLADLLIEATGTLTWYALQQDAENGQNPLAENYVIADGTNTYYVTQTIDGCESNPFAVTVTTVLGTHSFEKGHFSVYPNPAQDILNIKPNDGLIINSVSFYNSIGQLIMKISTTDVAPAINISSLAEGTYIISIASETGIYGARFIKR